jgi:hypothetical protein
MEHNSRSRSGTASDRIVGHGHDTGHTEHRRDDDRNSEAVSVIVEAFLERDLLPEADAEKASRHHAAGNHPEALQVILEARRSGRSRAW